MDREQLAGLAPLPSASESAASDGAELGEEGLLAHEMDHGRVPGFPPLPSASEEGAGSPGVEGEEEGGAVHDTDCEHVPGLAPLPPASDVDEGKDQAASVVPLSLEVDYPTEEDTKEEQQRQEEQERGAGGADAVAETVVSHGMEGEDEGTAAYEIENTQLPSLAPLLSDFAEPGEGEVRTSLAPFPVANDDVAEEDEEEEEAASAMAMEEKEPTSTVSNARGRGGGRRKRGRPPKAQVGRLSTKKKEEEDLCFICFDGGNLVVCDRRGCPKVYHPACVNRDESFFRSKGRWNCGWHICSVCEKAAHYLCLTCTYSLCKACIKEAVFVCVRGNKGFCETCRSTVMLIETNEQEKKETAGVDFDDRSSWMYLFKDYWLDLKRKLSITLEEVSRAKNPWKGPLAQNEESSDEMYDAKEDTGSSSDSSSVRREGNKPARKKARRRTKATTSNEEQIKLPSGEGTSLLEDSEWASEELLEFVAHMRHGDKSIMCQFDVHTLLLEYIKRNNLRDPRRKSQIICDSRLEKLFGKARVGHFEMLKLLESHFLVKETSQAVTDDNQGGVVDPESSQMDTEGHSEVVPKTTSDKKRRSRKRIEEREPQNNLDDYAAINIHNISLIYMRRNLMEELLDDTESFNDKAVGSFVRIRISGAGQRQDMYRLVQVVGTGKAAEKYKTGKRTTDITLEILNLSKMEVISIDSISNQEFTEEECERLRQSIKCGLISRLTVRDVLEKAMALQTVRVNEALENEKLRLSHLRDRASEKGRRKELRECVEKLQLLNSPEERSRRLNDIPEVHTDPNMDPNYESAEEESGDKRQDNFTRSTDSRFSRMGRESNSSLKGNLASGDSWSGSRRSSAANWESSKSLSTRSAWDKVDTSNGSIDRGNEVNRVKDLYQANSWDMSKTQPSAASKDNGVWSNVQAGTRPGQSSCLSTETSSTSQCTETAVLSNINENEKMWHYQDPSGKIQGPFSMTQLRKWNTTGYFPPNLRIWRTSEKQEDSILLADALIGKFEKEPQPLEILPTTSTQFSRVAQVMDARESNSKDNWRANNSSWAEKRSDDGSLSHNASQSSGWCSPNMDPVVIRDGKVSGSPHVWGSSKDPNTWSNLPQVHDAPPPSAAPFSGNSYQLSTHQGRGRGGNVSRWKGGPSHGNSWGPNRPVAFQPSSHGIERQHSTNYVYPGHQSPGELWKVQMTSNSNHWGNDSLNLPTPTPGTGGGGWMGNQSIGNQSSASLTVSPVQPTASQWATTATQGGNGLQFSPVAVNGASKTCSAWVEQSPSTAHAPACWGPNPLLKPTEMAACWDSSANAAVSMAKESVLADGSGTSRAPSLQNVLSVGDPFKDVKPDSGKAGTFISSITPCDFQNSRHVKDECPSPTPKDEQAKLDALVSESSQQNSVDVDPKSQSLRADGSFPNGSSVKSVGSAYYDATGASPAAMQTSKTSASNTHGLDRSQEREKVLAENATITQDDTHQILPPESLESEMQNKLVAATNLEINQSSYLASSAKNDHTSNELSNTNPAGGAGDLEFLSSQRHVLEPSDPRYSSESQGKSSNLSQRQETDNLVLISALKGDSLDQNQSQNPSQVHALEPAKSGSLCLPTDRNEWSMPSPTPTIDPALSHSVAESAFGVNAPSSAQWNPSVHLDPIALSNAGQGTGNREIKHVVLGMSQENMNRGVELSKESGHIELGAAVQGTTSGGLQTVMHGNPSGVWANPSQGNTNVNVGWAAPGQANANMNMVWLALTQANPSWGNPVQGNPSPGPGWVLTTPTNTPTVPSWGAVAPQGNPNTSQNWGSPAQGNANAGSGWAVPQNNSNSNVGWFGQGNMNMGSNASAGNPGNWVTPPKHNADGYPGHDDRGFQNNDSGHGGVRHGWNRSQNSGAGGGGSSRAPPRGQKTGICKFHESGHCKKGAACNYLHT